MVAVAVGEYGCVLISGLSNLPFLVSLFVVRSMKWKKYWQNILEHWTNKVKSHFEQTGGLHLAASKFVYNLADKNVLLFLGEFFWVLCITLLKELFKSSFMLRQFCLVIVWYNSERKKYCFIGTLCEAMSPSVVIGSKDFKPEGILIVIETDTCIIKKCSVYPVALLSVI